MNGRAHELLDDYEAALRDMIRFYDRVRGVTGHGDGWTTADVLRLEEIRKLAWTGLPKRDSRHLQPRSGANGSGKPSKPRKGRKGAPIAP